MNLIDHVGDILHGLLVTLELTGLSYVGALLIGTAVAVFRISPVPPLRALGTAYVASFRNVPLLVLLILFVFGLPQLGLLYPLFGTVVVALALYFGSYVAEAVRSGILTVPVGQGEAARATGLTFGQSLRLVILPQALRSMVQPLVNILTSVVVSTSLVAAVGVEELTGVSERLNLEYAEPVVTIAVAAAGYLVLNLCGGLLGGVLERRTAIRQ